MTAIAVRRSQLEATLGRSLPFDNAALEYLQQVAPPSDAQELAELVNDFCPGWPKGAQAALAKLLQDGDPECLVGSGGARGGSSASGSLARGPQARSFQQDQQSLEADMLLARMLQEEEEAEAALAGGNRPGARSSKARQKKGFRPLNINYTVGRNEAPATLGHAAPSSLADLLRNRRSQQSTAAMLHPSNFGPPASDGRAARWSPWQVDGSGLTWAERAQVGRAEQEVVEEASKEGLEAAVAPSAPKSLRLGSRKLQLLASNGTSYMIEVDSSDRIADIKARVEKQHSIPAARQRILLLGRELLDTQELASANLRDGQPLQLALRNTAEPPPASLGGGLPAPQRDPPLRQQRPAAAAPPVSAPATKALMKLRLQLPGGVSALESVQEFSTVGELKQRIQQSQGIRANHQILSFFGSVLEDSNRLAECGIADGALINVAMGLAFDFPGASSGKAPTKAVQAPARVELQTSQHGRVLTEEEALELALAASKAEMEAHEDDIAAPGGAIDDEDRKGGFGGPLGEDDIDLSNVLGEFHVEVSTQDDRLAPLIDHARRIASTFGGEDFIGRVSKRSGYRLTLLVEKGKKPRSILGYVVYRFSKSTVMSVVQVGVAGERRGTGVGRQLVSWLVACAKKASVDTIVVSCRRDGARFYGDLGFKHTQAQISGGEALQTGEVAMVYCRRKVGGGASASAKKVQANSSTARSALAIASTTTSRAELIKKIFSLLDADGDGRLDKQELHTFAEQTGFNGSDEEWIAEYELLCSESGSPPGQGISQASLAKLVDDDSDTGCYCTDVELQQMLRKLEAQGRKAVAAPPQPATPIDPPPSRRRRDLVQRLFDLLDADGDGWLNEQEMHGFAVISGFDGTEAEWASEYASLVAENKAVSGIDSALLARLIDDESDAGCHLEDEELVAAVAKLEASPPEASRLAVPKQPASAGDIRALSPVLAPSASPEPEAPSVSAPAQDAAETSMDERRARMLAVFAACDRDGDNHLNEKEMATFARHTGFDSSDEEWALEYKMLCDEGGSTIEEGIGLDLFCRLVDDQSDDGCYCTDKELQEMLEALTIVAQQPVSTPSHSVAQQPLASPDTPEFWLAAVTEEPLPQTSLAEAPVTRSVPAAEGPPVLGTLKTARERLIRDAFDACDLDGDGRLNAAELRLIAAGAGFEGSDLEWRDEFQKLCEDWDLDVVAGLDFDTVRQLVDDNSDRGCYCDDVDLQKIIKDASASKAREADVQRPIGLPPGLHLDGEGDSSVHEEQEGQLSASSWASSWAPSVAGGREYDKARGTKASGSMSRSADNQRRASDNGAGKGGERWQEDAWASDDRKGGGASWYSGWSAAPPAKGKDHSSAWNEGGTGGSSAWYSSGGGGWNESSGSTWRS